MTLPCALTIAGSDSSGGAGIQADLRTFAALAVYGASAITAVTSQNTRGVRAVSPVAPALVADQIDAVLDDLDVRAVKTGMLANASIVSAVASRLNAYDGAVVVDPVLVSTSGTALLDDDGVELLRTRLLPRAHLVTPNLDEAARLMGFPVRSVDDQMRAARALVDETGAHAALIKGGHADGAVLIDVLFDGIEVHTLTSKRIDTRHTHGTGCTLSAAITAELAKGAKLVDAVTRAHAYVHEAIAQAANLGVGRGRGPLHHMHRWYAA
jgi:hydroxymethylpyrimidine/phosphomethylpyrimidine kinase